MKKIKLLLATLLFGLPILVPVSAQAQFNPLESSCSEVPNSSSSEICAAAESDDNLVSGERSIFLIIADILTLAAGAVAVVMVIISGITMITSSGDSAKVKKSRDTIIYSVVGIFVVILSRSIVIFIVGQIG
jgi:type IV secretory pathway VirB2 component (pilin)